MDERMQILAAEVELICENHKQAEIIAEELIKLDYRKERYCEWIRDETFTGKSKELYICSACNWYQAIKKTPYRNKLTHLKYCPSCGAMAVNCGV